MSAQDIVHKIQTDFKRAYLGQEKKKAAVLSLLKSALHNQEIALRGQELGAEEVYAVIKREIKEREEALEELKKAGRAQSAQTAAEKEAIAILQNYLPPALPAAEITKLAKQVIKEVDAHSPQDLGKVMGKLMPRLGGSADGTLVRQIVQDLLTH